MIRTDETQFSSRTYTYYYMADKKTAVGFDQIMRDLKARNFAPIYVLMGDESYYIDKIADFIAGNVLTPEERDFNQNIVFGADTTDCRPGQRVSDDGQTSCGYCKGGASNAWIRGD